MTCTVLRATPTITAIRYRLEAAEARKASLRAERAREPSLVRYAIAHELRELDAKVRELRAELERLGFGEER